MRPLSPHGDVLQAGDVVLIDAFAVGGLRRMGYGGEVVKLLISRFGVKLGDTSGTQKGNLKAKNVPKNQFKLWIFW